MAVRSRWILPVGVAAILLFVEIAALGVSGAGAGPDPGVGSDELPEELAIPMPRVGDEVRYTYSLIPDDAKGAEPWIKCNDEGIWIDGNNLLPVKETPVPYLDFRMEAPATILDEGGQSRRAYSAHVLQYGFDCEENAVPGIDAVQYVDAGTLAPIAYVAGRAVQSDGPEGRYTSSSTAVGYASEIFGSMGWSCFAWLTWQGTILDLSRRQRIAPECQLPIYEFHSDAPAFEGGWGAGGTDTSFELPLQADRVEYVDGHKVVVLRVNGTHQGEVWMSPDFPYPLRYVSQAHGSQNPADNRVLTIQMSGFKAGHTPLPRADDDTLFPEKELRPVVDLEFAPRQPWGMDETGFDSTFPASDAWSRLATAEATKAYMEAHPKACAIHARGGEETFQWHESSTWYINRTSKTWYLAVSDGSQALDVFVRKSHETRTSKVPPALMVGPYARTENVSYEVTARARSIEQGLGLDELPVTMPTVASLRKAFIARAPGSEPNHWGFDFSSRERNGIYPLPTQDWQIGLVRTNRTSHLGLGGLAPQENETETKSILRYRDDGYTVEFLAGPERESPAEGVLPLSSQGSDPSLRLVGTGLAWSIPPAPVVAGASVVALVAGAVVALVTGKGVKGLGLAFLFSRVQPDKATDHPARQSILQAIEATPGIHFKEVQRRLGLSKSSAQHHLATLLRARLIQERRDGGYVCYFPGQVADRRILSAAPLLRAPGARQLFAAALEHPGSNAQELAGHTGLQPSTANYHLHRFAQAGLIVMVRSSHGLQVDVTELGRVVHGAGVAG